MKCFRCHREIQKGEHMFIMIEMNNDIEIRRNYVHAICWDNFLKQVGSVEESMGMIRGLKKFFVKQGVLPGEEYVVK